MRHKSKFKLTGYILIVLVTMLACNLPFGIGIEREPGEVAQLPTNTPFATSTPTAIPTSTFTPTNTPEPTPTATLVVLPTATPTAVSGASGVSVELGGDPTAIAAATAEMAAAAPSKPVAGSDNVIVNGDFEAAWPDIQAVATGWMPFDNGKAHFGWYKDTWHKVVFDGENAQLIEIINDAGQGDRYAGIYQTVKVVAGAEYELIIHGLVRSDEGSEGVSGSGYALQYGLDYNGGNDWKAVTEWITFPFPEHPREDPNASNVYNYGTYSAKITPKGKTLTLFIRAWKKWADLNEGNFDVDAVSLRGTGAAATATLTPPSTVEAPTATPQPVPTDTPAPTITPTFLPEMPASGGVLDTESPSKAVLLIAVLSVFIFSAGAIVGVIRRRQAG